MLGGRIADPNHDAYEGATMSTLPCAFNVNSQMCRIDSYNFAQYFEIVGQDLVVNIIR